jgi:hypothetical protein
VHPGTPIAVFSAVDLLPSELRNPTSGSPLAPRRETMQDSLSGHRPPLAFPAVCLLIWFCLVFTAPGWSLSACGTIPSIDAALHPISFADLSSPYSPQRENASITLIKDRDDNDQSTEDEGNLTRIGHSSLTLVQPLAVRLPPSPTVASDAFRLSPPYQITQRIRL